MGWTKRNLVESALDEIGISSNVYSVQPEQLQSAMSRMDNMVAYWLSQGIRLGYPLPASPTDGSLDHQAGIPDTTHLAVVLNLAVQLAPSYGKPLNPATVANAHNTYQALIIAAAQPIPYQYPANLPMGAGWKNTIYPYSQLPVQRLGDPPNGVFNFQNGSNAPADSSDT